MIKYIKAYPIRFFVVLIFGFVLSSIVYRLYEINHYPEIQKEVYERHYAKEMESFINDANSTLLPDGAIRANELIEHPENEKRYLVYGYPSCFFNTNCILLYPGYNHGMPLTMENPDDLKYYQRCSLTHDQKNNWIPVKSCLILMDGFVRQNDKKEFYFSVRSFLETNK